MLAHFPNALIFTFVTDMHLGMTQHHICHLFQRRFLMKDSLLQIINDISEQPWVASGTSGCHNGITSCFLNHPPGILRSKDITISDHRNLHCFFYPADDLPIGLAAIILFPGSSVNSNCRSAIGLRDLSHLYRIDMVIIKTFSDLDCHRLVNGIDQTSDNPARQLRLLHQRRSLTIVDNFRHRTSHIDIQHIKISVCDHSGRFCHDIRI